jgi:hypothetical protein
VSEVPLINDGHLRDVVRAVLEEFVRGEQMKVEPAQKNELTEERKRRETLETRVNELIAENQRSRAKAEEVERGAAIRTELQKLGVTKVELAYRAVKEDVYRSEDGRLLGRGGEELGEFLAEFVGENPELLPARLAGGSGASAGQRGVADSAVDLATIRPGMSAEEMDRVRREVARVALQTLKGI